MRTDLENLLFTVHFSSWKVRQVIILNWCDGPIQGLCELSEPNCCFRFDVFGINEWADDIDDHLYRVSEIPTHSVQLVLSLLSKQLEPKAPRWVPDLTFADEKTRELIDDTYSRSRPTRVIVRTTNMIDFLGCWMVYEGLIEI